MNDQQRAAMQMALEALEYLIFADVPSVSWIDKTDEAITALREALAQPQDIDCPCGSECEKCSSRCLPQGEDDLTIAYMVGYEKGKDETKEKAAKMCEELKQNHKNIVVRAMAADCAAAIRSMK